MPYLDRKKATNAAQGWVAVVAVVGLVAAPAAASDLHVQGPRTMRVGEHAALTLTLPAAGRSPAPVMITPAAAGDAVEVVRGRLLGAEASRDADGRLRFALPVVARKTGAGLVHLHVLRYRCEPSCELESFRSQWRLDIAAPPSSGAGSSQTSP